jgi:hypothetical protein
MSDTLRSGLIRLAFENPSLRGELLPLLEKHAGEDEMEVELEADADPASHDQNLPEHYYFSKAAKPTVESLLRQFASPVSKNQNKPESYYGLPPKGKQAAAKEKYDYSPETGEVGKLRDDLVKALKKKGLEVEEGSSRNTLYIDGEKVAIHGPHLESDRVNEWVHKPSRKEWLDEAVKLLGKKASRPLAPGVHLIEDLSVLGPNFRLVFRELGGDFLGSEQVPGYYLDLNGMLKLVYKTPKMSPAGEAQAKKTIAKLITMLKAASSKTASGSGAANAAFLRQSPLKDKILRAVAKHYGTSVAAIEAELTDPDAEAVFEYIGNDAALQMQVYREFNAKGFGKRAAAGISA